MKINTATFRLTPAIVRDLHDNYESEVEFYDHFADSVVYEGPADELFWSVFKDRVSRNEADERWETTYSRTSARGWERIEQKVYKGTNPRLMEAGDLHLSLVIRIKPSGSGRKTEEVEYSEEPTKRSPGFWKFVRDFFTALFSITLFNIAFPSKEDSFVKNFLIGWGSIKLFGSKKGNRED